MDAPNLILRDDVGAPNALPDVNQVKSASQLRKQEAAKKFEAVLIDKLLSQMKNTVIDWGSEKDGTSKQIDGIFWSCLADGISKQGGFGLWKDIYKYINDLDGTAKGTTSTSGTTIESVG